MQLTVDNISAAITEAANIAKLPDSDRNKMLALVRPGAKFVRGGIWAYGSHCPASAAGIYKSGYPLPSSVMDFMEVFDRLTKVPGVYGPNVIDVI